MAVLASHRDDARESDRADFAPHAFAAMRSIVFPSIHGGSSLQCGMLIKTLTFADRGGLAAAR
jgi:hypothetical protein